MGEKTQRRTEGNPPKSHPISRGPSLGSPLRQLLTPAALLAGFILGTFLGRPLFFPPPSDSATDSSAPSFSEPLPHVSSKKVSTKSSVPNSRTNFEDKWDEKTIKSLPAAEVRARLAQLSTWTPGLLADQTERWLVQRWASLEPKLACVYAYTAALQGAD